MVWGTSRAGFHKCVPGSFCYMLVRFSDASVVHLWWHNGAKLWYDLGRGCFVCPFFFLSSSCSTSLRARGLLWGGAVASGDRHSDMHMFAMTCVGIQVLTNRNK